MIDNVQPAWLENASPRNRRLSRLALAGTAAAAVTFFPLTTASAPVVDAAPITAPATDPVVGIADGNGGFYSSGIDGAIGHQDGLSYFSDYLGWSDPQVPG